MTTMINPTANGSKRASLNEQINRLDSMLEGLSEGLNEAVADAVKAGVGTAVKEAVQAVLMEVLTNPDLLAKLHMPSDTLANDPGNTAAATTPKTPGQRLRGWWQRVRACISSLRAACAEPMRKLRTSAASAWQWTCTQGTALRARYEMLRPFKYQILMALAIGLVMAVSVGYAEPWFAAIVSGIGGFVTTLAVQAGLWLRKILAINAEPAT